MNKPKILIKIIFNNGKVSRVSSSKKRRIWNFLKADTKSKSHIKVCVNYGNGKYNCGEYLTRAEAIGALKAFLEVEV